MKLIVPAGGQGTKIWPYSRDSKPKQFQTVLGDQSLFTYNINLISQWFSPNDIYISTKKMYVKWVIEQAPKIPMRNLIIEPDIKKDRGPAEGYAFLRLSIEASEEPFMLIQSDCLRLPEENFKHMLEEAEKLVKRDKKYITGGTKANYPVLGVDYLRLGDKVPMGSDLEVYRIEEFVERTGDYYKTKELIENFYITTHSNHACWYPDLMLEAYGKFRADWYEALMKIREVIGKPNEEEVTERIYSEMAAGPTEEVTKHVFPDGYVILLPFKWTDIGTWDSVYEYFAKDGEVYADGKVLAVESSGSLVKCYSKEKLVALLDVHDLVIVDTEDVLLIVPRNKVDSIKEIHSGLIKEKLEQYL
jgi:mannose-1-phosphate guanylyltransferase